MTGTRRPTATTSGLADRVPPGGEPRIDAGRHDVHARRLEPQLRDQLLLRRLRERDDRRAAVDRRRDPRLDRVPERRQPRRQRHAPHPPVDVVQPRDVRPTRPHRREEGHPVPDLDEGVTLPVPSHDLAEDGPREDHVATGLADHPVALPPRHHRVPRRVRGAHRHLYPGLGPQSGRPPRRGSRTPRPRGRRGRARPAC